MTNHVKPRFFCNSSHFGLWGRQLPSAPVRAVQWAGMLCWLRLLKQLTRKYYSFDLLFIYFATDPQQLQKAMCLQGHEDWVRGVAWAFRSEWGRRLRISHKSNFGRSDCKSPNAVFRNDQFCVHVNRYQDLNSQKNTDCWDFCVIAHSCVRLHLSFCQLCKPLQACTVCVEPISTP